MDVEKGAVLGEARYRNGSNYVALVEMLHNHGGNGWQIQRRFPIGIPSLIAQFTEAQVIEFVTKWYRLDRMRLMVVGDLSTATASSVIKQIWGPETLRAGQGASSPSDPELGTISPQNTFFIREVPGINGVQLNLLITSPLERHPYTANMLRQHTLNTLFMLTYELQMQAMLQYNYDWQQDVQYGGRSAGVAVELDYSLGTTLRAFSVQSPGNAQTGTWRTDWEMALTELRRLAINGPPAALVVGMMYVVSNMLESEKRMSGIVDSISIIDMVLGDSDPTHVYQDFAQQCDMQQKFLGLGYVRAAQLHIQAEAQLLWKALVELATDKPYTEGPFGGIRELDKSLNVFTDSAYPAGAHITKEAVLTVVKQVQDAAPPDGVEMVLSGMVDLSPTEGIPKRGYLIDIPSSKSTAPQHVATDTLSGVQQYRLDNGIMVNFKPSLSGAYNSPAGPTGELLLQVVSLGGKSTQTPTLTGACEVVNLGVNSGNSVVYDENTIDYSGDTVHRYLSSAGVSASLTCGLEETIISSKLSSACANYPKLTCKRNDHKNYYRALEAVRLAMNPLYDDTSIARAVTKMEERAATLSRTADPMQLMSSSLEPLFLQHIFPNDPRFASATPMDVKALNPFRVQNWIREQFRANNTEINVVGDANYDQLLKQLNYVLGSIPVSTPYEMIGHDIYNLSAAHFFDVQYPDDSYNLSCTIPSVSPNRGYVVAYGAAPDYYQYTNDSTRGIGAMLASHTAASLWAMWNVRVLRGYGYFAIVSAHHSLLFGGFGYYSVEWEPGNYPEPLADDPLNLKRSVEDVARDVFSKFPTDIVKDSLQQLITQTKTKYVVNSYWLEVLKGIALRPPVWINLQTTFIKSLRSTEVLQALQALNATSIETAMTEKGFLFSASLATISIPILPTSKPTLNCTSRVNLL